MHNLPRYKGMCSVLDEVQLYHISSYQERERRQGGGGGGMHIILDKSDRELFVMPDFYGLAEDLFVSCLS